MSIVGALCGDAGRPLRPEPDWPFFDAVSSEYPVQAGRVAVFFSSHFHATDKFVYFSPQGAPAGGKDGLQSV